MCGGKNNRVTSSPCVWKSVKHRLFWMYRLSQSGHSSLYSRPCHVIRWNVNKISTFAPLRFGNSKNNNSWADRLCFKFGDKTVVHRFRWISHCQNNCRASFDADIDGVWIAYIDDSRQHFFLINVSMRAAHKSIDKYSSGHRRYWRGLSTGSHDYVSHIIAVPFILRSDKMGGHADRSNRPIRLIRWATTM